MATTVVNGHKAHFDVYIGRGSKWGNPFKIGRDGTRDEVIRKYVQYFYEGDLYKYLPELKDKVLGCFCAPLACHGDFLAGLADKE